MEYSFHGWIRLKAILSHKSTHMILECVYIFLSMPYVPVMHASVVKFSLVPQLLWGEEGIYALLSKFFIMPGIRYSKSCCCPSHMAKSSLLYQIDAATSLPATSTSLFPHHRAIHGCFVVVYILVISSCIELMNSSSRVG